VKLFKNKFFDKNLKSKTDISLYHLEPSKNIFEEAWLKKDEKVTNKNFIFRKPAVKIAISAACFMVVSLTAVFSYCPSARALAAEAYDNIRTIFSLEKTSEGYKIVEETENKALGCENIGGITVNDNNKAKLEERLGFSIFYPQKLGDTFEESSKPSVGVQVSNIKLKEIEALRDNFMKALTDDTAFKELSKYTMKPFVCTNYSDKNDSTYTLYISKTASETIKSSEIKVIKKVNIENITCSILEIGKAIYPQKTGGGWCSDDITQKPTDIVNKQYVNWEYNGLTYSITTLSSDFNSDTAIKLVQEYMKSIKEKQVK